MKLDDAILKCHVRSAIYRTSQGVEWKYWKNHRKSLKKRIPLEDQKADDWEEYDPREHETYHDPA